MYPVRWSRSSPSSPYPLRGQIRFQQNSSSRSTWRSKSPILNNLCIPKKKKTVGTFNHGEENIDYSQKMEESSFPLGGTHLQTETREEEYLLAEKKNLL